MDTEFVKMLFTYNDWANMQLLETATQLTDADYHKTLGPAWGSVHGTLAHLCDADDIWFTRWQGQDTGLRKPEGLQYTTFSMVREAWEPVMSKRRAWLEKLTAEQLASSLSYKTSSGEPFTHPLWWQLYHVANHSTDHRSHISLMMTEAGHPPPALDFIRFVRL